MATKLAVVVALAVLFMLLLILIVLFLSCRPWRLFFISRFRTIKIGELERPLVSDDVAPTPFDDNEPPINYDLDGDRCQNEGQLGYFRSPRTQGLVHKSRVSPIAPNSVQGDSLAIDVITEHSEDILVGQTLKRPLLPHLLSEGKKKSRESSEHAISQAVVSTPSYEQSLVLEVISGPSRGMHCSMQPSDSTMLSLTLGRVPPSDLALKDSEVSGKHAVITWNVNNLRWEVRDMGSLNGTLLNTQRIHRSDSGSRRWGEAFELSNGDIISLGPTSKVHVHITSENECRADLGVGVASDPMAMRRGGKKFPMEDVCYYHWPLPGLDKFGVFGICDGHGGAEAAKSASRILPKMVASNLSDAVKRERVLSECDASDVLRDAFFKTEESLNHQYEGCTATLLLVWSDRDENLYAQCANLGDSHCVYNVDGQPIKMTEDHRVSSSTERRRMQEQGQPIKDGEIRLCGLNLARMLGDKFLKQQDSRFSSEPYISQAVRIDRASSSFALLASDGLWDVMTVRKAVQLVLQVRERYASDKETAAEKVANYLLSEARTLRTKDNTSVIYLDFDSLTQTSCEVES